MKIHKLLACLVLLAGLGETRAEERTRRILLPRDEFLKLGSQFPEGAYLSDADLERLRKRVAEARADQPDSELGRVPLGLASAAYQGEFLPGVLRVRGVLDLATDRQDWQSLVLPRLGTLLSARFARGTGALSLQQERLTVWTEGAGPVRLELWFDIPLQLQGELQQTWLDLGAPGGLSLALPPSMDVTLDGVPLQPESAGLPRALVPLAGNPRQLALRPKALGSGLPQIEATGQHSFQIHQGALQGVHQWTIQSWSQQPLKHLELQLPEADLLVSIRQSGFEGGLRSGFEDGEPRTWQQAQQPAGLGLNEMAFRQAEPAWAKIERQGRVLRLELLRPVFATQLSLVTSRPLIPGSQQNLQVPKVLAAQWQIGVVDLKVTGSTELRCKPGTGAQQLPAGPDQSGTLRYFLAGASAFVGIEAVPVPKSVQAQLTGVYRLAAESVKLTGLVRWTTQQAPLRSLDLELDVRDRLIGVQLDGIDAAWENLASGDPARQKVRIAFPRDGISSLVFQTERLLDRTALDAGPAAVELLTPRLPGLDDSQVLLGVGADPELHLALREKKGFFLRNAEENPELPQTAALSGLAAQPIAYALLAAPDAGPLGLELDRRLPRLEAETTSFLHFTEAALKVQAEVRFTVRDAPTDQLRISLPAGTGNRVRIEVEGLQERVLESTPQADLYTLRLREKRLGQIAVSIAFDTPLETGLRQELALPEVGAAGVTRDEGTVLLEAADNLALRVLAVEGRELALEDLAAAAFYTPSDRLLAAYKTLARPYGLRVEVLRYEPLPLLGSVATEARLRSALLPDGRLQTEARYTLVNSAAQFLPVRLAKDTRLWSVLLDQEPVKPFRRGEQILIALHPGTQSVVLLYETREPMPDWFSRLRMTPPDIGVPALRLYWDVYPPEGYEAYLDGFGRQASTGTGSRRLNDLIRVAEELTAFALMPQVVYYASMQPKMAPYRADEAAEVMGYGSTISPAAPGQSQGEGYLDGAKGDLGRQGEAKPESKAKFKDNEDAIEAEMDGKKPKPMKPVAKVPAFGKAQLGLGVLPLKLGLETNTTPLSLSALTGEGSVRLFLAPREMLGRAQACVLLLVAAACLLAIGFPRFRTVFLYIGLLLILDTVAQLVGTWSVVWFNAASDGVVLGAAASLLLRIWRRWARPVRLFGLLLLTGLPAWAEDIPQPQVSTQSASRVPPVATPPPTTLFVPYRLVDGEIFEDVGAFVTGPILDQLFRQGQSPEAVKPKPPIAFSLRWLRLEGELDGQGAALKARLEFDLAGDAWTEVPLGLAGPFDRALLDGAPAAFVAKEGGLQLVARGRGSHVLELGLRIADQDPGPGLELHLPRIEALAGRLELSLLPGFEAELSPQQNFERLQKADRTVLVTALGGTALVVRARPAAEGLESRLRVDNRLELEIQPDRMRLAGRILLEDSQPLPEELTLRCPAGLIPKFLQGAGLKSWSRPAEDRLVLRLEPGLQRLELTLESVLGAGGLQAIRPEGSVELDGLILVSYQDTRVPELTEQRGLRRLSPEEGLAAWGSAPRPGTAPRLWAFAPDGSDFGLTLQAETARPIATCRTSVLLRLDEPGAELVMAFDLDVREAPLFSLPFDLPQGWRFEEGRAETEALWRPARSWIGRTRAQVDFPQGILGRARLVSRWSISFQGTEGLPSLALPIPFLGPNITSNGGELGLSAASGLEAVLEAKQEAKLSPVQPETLQVQLEGRQVDQAYRFRERPTGEIRIRTQKARVSVSVVEHVYVGESHLEGQALLLYEASRPGVDTLRFRVPQAISKTMEVDAQRIRNVVKIPQGTETLVTVELQSPVSGAVPLEVRWSVPLVQGSESTLPRIQPDQPAAAEAYVLVETDPVLLVAEPVRQEAEVIADPEQIPSLPSRLRLENVRWILRYRGPQSAVRIKAERLKTEGVLQAIVDLVDLQSVVDAEGRCRTRVRFELQNRTEQFLDVTLPQGTELWSAAVAGQPVKAARSPSGAAGEIRVPLPKQSDADLSFAAELWYVSRVPLDGLRGGFDLTSPRVTNLPVKKTLWTVWMPEGLGLSFAGSLDPASEGELTTEKALEVLDLQNRLVGALESSVGRKREKIVQNLESLQQRYSQLDQTAQQQLRSSFRRGGGGGDEMDAERRNQVSLDQLDRSRAVFDENLRKAREAPADNRIVQQNLADAPLQQSLTANWALTNKGLNQVVQNEKQIRDGEGSDRDEAQVANLDRLFFADDGSRLQKAGGERAGKKTETAKELVGNTFETTTEEMPEGGVVEVTGEAPVIASPDAPVPEEAFGQSAPFDDRGAMQELPAASIPNVMPSTVLAPSEPEPMMDLDVRPVPPVEAAASVRREGILGLSLEFPLEGQSYHFKGLHGDGSIQVSYTASRLWSVGWGLASLLGLLAVLFLLDRIARRLSSPFAALGRWARRWSGWLLGLSAVVFLMTTSLVFLILAFVAAGLRLTRKPD